MSVSDALERDLDAMPSRVRDSALAESARVLAATLDGMPGARDAASCAKELRAHLVDLKTASDVTPEQADPIDCIIDSAPSRQPSPSHPNGAARANR
jgi:hypothetical protein